ncbi:MAG TPA: cation:proton antiporter [Cyclobacteriaceae bacterium]|nr:cation:proton antiporter [Cyclobacteriaceae bacterium]
MHDIISLIEILSIFIIVAVAGSRLARYFPKVKLPLITGLLITGVICGPYVLKIVPREAYESLSFLREITIAFIAFAAGSELYLNEMRGRLKSIRWMTLGQLVFTFVFGSILVFLLSDFVPYMKEQPVLYSIAISLLTGTIFVTRSPASAIAVINELRAKGPFTQTLLGVTVVKDFLVIILFGIVLSIAESIFKNTSFNFVSITFILIELILSFLTGYFLYLLLRFLLSLKIEKYYKTFFILVLGFLTYQLSHLVRDNSIELTGHRLHLEPLLICLVSSFYLTNFSKFRSEFLQIIEDISDVIYVVFFIYVGISLDLEIFYSIWPIAFIFFGIRCVSIIFGSLFGTWKANDPGKYYPVSWMPYISQGPVALGLTAVIANQFPDWGPQLLTIIIGTTVINHLLGDPLLKFSIRYVGEDRSRAHLQKDGKARRALIFGYENQAVALANQLKANGWKPEIITTDSEYKNNRIDNIELVYFDSLTYKNLETIKAGKADSFVALLTDEENLEICELAYQKYGTKDLIVRLNDRANFNKFHNLGALIVEPSTAIVSLLDHFVRSPQATSLLLGMQKDQDTRDIELLNPNLHGIYLRDLRLPPDLIVLSVKRGGQMIISHGYTRLRLGDVITLVGTISSLENVSLRFAK